MRSRQSALISTDYILFCSVDSNPDPKNISVNDLLFSDNLHYEAVGSVIPNNPASQVSVMDTQDLYVTAIS